LHDGVGADYADEKLMQDVHETTSRVARTLGSGAVAVSPDSTLSTTAASSALLFRPPGRTSSRRQASLVMAK
jgi:hypothetical protein